MERPRTTNKHLPMYVTVIHGSFWFRPPEGKDECIGRIEDGEHQVWEFMAKRTRPSDTPRTTLNHCFDRYLREVVPNLSPRTQRDYARHINKLRVVFGDCAPDEVKKKHIGQFLDRPKGKIQANRQVAVLSAVYAKIVGRWYLAENNPCIGVERNASKKRTRYVTDIEFNAIRTFAGPRIRLAMDLALLTGQRQGDLISLPWKNVTDEGILFRQGKTGKRLLVGMSPDLKAVLARAKLLEPGNLFGTVIQTRKGHAYTSEGFRAMWQRMIVRAVEKNVIGERFTFHDLRAKSVSDTKNIQEAFERAGHTSMAMTRGVYDRGIRKVTPLK